MTMSVTPTNLCATSVVIPPLQQMQASVVIFIVNSSCAFNSFSYHLRSLVMLAGSVFILSEGIKSPPAIYDKKNLSLEDIPVVVVMSNTVKSKAKYTN